MYENGVPAEEAAGISPLSRDADVAVYKVGSGVYHFTVRPPTGNAPDFTGHAPRKAGH